MLENHDIINAAMHLLKYRSRSCQEIKSRLSKKGYSDIDIEQTVSYLIDLGYLNDYNFAKLFVKDKIRQKGVGPIYLINELKKHNISKNIIDNSIDYGFSKFSLNEIVDNHIQKRLKLLKNKSAKEKKQKIIQFLQRKGFEWNQISSELEKYFMHNSF